MMGSTGGAKYAHLFANTWYHHYLIVIHKRMPCHRIASKHTMDSLHFREYQRGMMVSNNESFPDADVHLNEVLSNAVGRGERIQVTDTLACIHWKGSHGSVTSTLTLTQPKLEDPDRIDEEFCEAMVRDPTQLHTFIRDVHKHQAVKLVTVKVHPIAFTFRHFENDLFVRCAKDFMNAIRCLVSNCVHSKPEIKTALKVNRENTDTCTSFHRGFGNHRTGNQSTRYCMTEGRNTQLESVASTKERFAVIDREMKKQKHFIETQFALHRQQNDEIMSTLSHVLCTLQAGLTSAEIQKVIAEEKNRLTQSFEKNDEPRLTVKDESQDDLASHTSLSTLSSDHQVQRNGPDDFSRTDHGSQENHGCTHEPVRKENRSDAAQTKENERATAATETSGTINTTKQDGVGKVADSLAASKVQTKYSRKNTRLFSSSTSSNVMTLDRLKAGQDTSGYKPSGKGEGQKVKTLANLKEEEWKEDREKHDATLAYLMGLHDPSDGTVDRDDVLKSLTSGKSLVPIKKERTRSGEPSKGRKRPVLDVQSLISSNPDDTRLWSGLEDVLQEDDDGSLRAEAALDTVFCLDTSGSISEQAFAQMKDIVLDFLTGIEEVAEKYDIEENVALVTFGGKAKVIHHLSNDYASLQDALEKVERGGPSPLLQSLVVALACLSRGGICNMGGLLVPPRIVFITDGLASAELPETAPDTTCPSEKDKMRLIGAVGALGSEHARTYIASPLVWIPIGEADRTFLESMVKLCHGKLLEGKDVKTLCNHQRLRRIASNVLVYMRRRDTESDNFKSEMEMVINALGDTLTTSEKEEIATLVKMNIYNVEGNLGAIDSFDNITTRDNLPPLGSRVVRGPDWMWGDQDSQGPGTVINHDADGPSVWVLWDNGQRNVYRCGVQNEFDVLIVDDQPRTFGDSHMVEIGAQVERGPHWQESYGNQDGGPGSHGTVIRRKGQIIMVRWDNESIHKYRFGENNMYDVAMRDPFACLLERSSPQSTKKSDTSLSLSHPQHTEKHGRPESDRSFVWQRNDGRHGWQDYTEAENAKMMTEYRKRKMGSCLLSRNGQSFRISFRNNIERSVEDNTTADIRKRFTD
ncbi:uncharacterized protein LOC124280404 isoform X2 [Haliotis rubra]|uniref:uncharacterized protein LOC124280404 isoform X2 n=1 Tax=Haliotis rubra TaxID=36100 RepID=UPI001EE5FC2C|nr:uncharacterized protein LOC124280404 isoform X2 [Haliotis rubra]